MKWVLAALLLVGCKVHFGRSDRLYGKTGEQFYAEAAAAMNAGDWLSAGVIISGSQALHVEAKKNHAAYVTDLERLMQRVQAGAGKFPIPVATDPPTEIYNTGGVPFADGLAVQVRYSRPPSVAEGRPLDVFAEQLHSKLIVQFPGLKNFGHVIYTAFNEPPIDPSRKYERWGTVVDGKTGRAEVKPSADR